MIIVRPNVPRWANETPNLIGEVRFLGGVPNIRGSQNV